MVCANRSVGRSLFNYNDARSIPRDGRSGRSRPGSGSSFHQHPLAYRLDSTIMTCCSNEHVSSCLGVLHWHPHRQDRIVSGVEIISSLQPNGVTLTFMMIGIRSVNGDFWRNKIVVPAFYHIVPADDEFLIGNKVTKGCFDSERDISKQTNPCLFELDMDRRSFLACPINRHNLKAKSQVNLLKPRLSPNRQKELHYSRQKSSMCRLKLTNRPLVDGTIIKPTIVTKDTGGKPGKLLTARVSRMHT